MKLILMLLAAVMVRIHSKALPKSFVFEKFSQFKKTHGKMYENATQESVRKGIFEKTLNEVAEHNEKYKAGLVSYSLAVNAFADMTEEEIAKHTQGLIEPAIQPQPRRSILNRSSLGITEPFQTPENFDWRDKGMVTSVKNQGSCGSCWAFSATGALESQILIKYGTNISTSEQQLVDCVYEDGCNGGWMANAYNYITKNGGINDDTTYPYEAKYDTCRFHEEAVVAKTVGYGNLKQANESVLADMVYTIGPIAVAIDSRGDFVRYSSGVYYYPNCTNSVTHGVLVVGFGSENGQDYWLVKNSWGNSWGDHGYIKMARNKDNHCAIASYGFYPILG